VQVRPDQSTLDRAVGPVAVADAGRHSPKRREVPVAHGAPRMVLEAGEREIRRAAVNDDFSDRAGPGARDGVEREETESFRTGAVPRREAAPEDLETGADREHDGAVGDAPTQHPVALQALDRELLRPVFSPADAVHVRGGERRVTVCLKMLRLDPTERRAAVQDDAVAPVPVGAEEVGVDGHDAQHQRLVCSAANAV
jgi:hypothetical protein